MFYKKSWTKSSLKNSDWGYNLLAQLESHSRDLLAQRPYPHRDAYTVTQKDPRAQGSQTPTVLRSWPFRPRRRSSAKWPPRSWWSCSWKTTAERSWMSCTRSPRSSHKALKRQREWWRIWCRCLWVRPWYCTFVKWMMSSWPWAQPGHDGPWLPEGGLHFQLVYACCRAAGGWTWYPSHSSLPGLTDDCLVTT